jgi:SAM-dependent methyltransferase
MRRIEKAERRKLFDALAPDRDRWTARFPVYHREVTRLVRSLVPPHRSVLEIGCGTGDLLHALQPRRGLGLDLSPEMIAVARGKYPDLEFAVQDADSLSVEEGFDYIVLSDLVGHLDDIWSAFRALKRASHPGTRIIVTYYNYLWEPIVRLAEGLGIKARQAMQNWLPPQDLLNLATVTGFEALTQGHRLLCPARVPLLAALLNRVGPHIPGLRRLGLVHFIVMRPEPAERPAAALSCSVVIPCRNEVGNIAETVARVPKMGTHTELIFVDGDSSDGTTRAIEDAIEQWRGARTLQMIRQVPASGKGDAVRRGFAAAQGDVLMILDADLSVAPEDLPKFFAVLAEGRAEFVNGSRLVYALEGQAMRLLNLIANKLFGSLFSWLLEQRIRDTLCGTKAVRRRDYERIAARRAQFGDWDPFGDFDLLFGAAALSLKIVEVPVRYHERTYGQTKIRRFYHGWKLVRMFCVALRRLKFR